MIDVAKGMQFLVGKKVIHRDLGCRNLLVARGDDKYIVKVVPSLVHDNHPGI